jgi:transcriptional regulator with XRE-family HTH domain
MPRFSRRTDADRGPLGSLLYSARRSADRNVEACAADTGLSVSFLHFAEQGRRTPALGQMLVIADAYNVDRRTACWAWVLQAAPDVAVYMVSHETVEGTPMLRSHFADQYAGQVREREAARKAANAARRVAQVLRRSQKKDPEISLPHPEESM